MLLEAQPAFATDLPAKLEALGEVAWAGACTTRDAVDRAVRQFDGARCDLIAVVLLTYCPSLYARPALLDSRLPLLLFNTQKLHAITPDAPEPDPLEDHSVHGLQDLANGLRRSGRAFQVVAGFAAVPGVRQASGRRLRRRRRGGRDQRGGCGAAPSAGRRSQRHGDVHNGFRGRVFMSHMGEGNWRMARAGGPPGWSSTRSTWSRGARARSPCAPRYAQDR